MIPDEILIAHLKHDRSEAGLLNVLYNGAIRYGAFRPEHYGRSHAMDKEQLEDLLQHLRHAHHDLSEVTSEEERASNTLHYTAAKSGERLEIIWQLNPTATRPQGGQCRLLFRTSTGHLWHAFRAPAIDEVSAELKQIEDDCRCWEEELPGLRQRIAELQQMLREGREALQQLGSALKDSPSCQARVKYSHNNYEALVQIQIAERRRFQFIIKAEMGAERLGTLCPAAEAAVAALRRAAHLNMSICTPVCRN